MIFLRSRTSVDPLSPLNEDILYRRGKMTHRYWYCKLISYSYFLFLVSHTLTTHMQFSFSHSFTLSHTHSSLLFHIHIYSLFHSLTLSLTHSLSLTLTLSDSLAHTHSPPLSLFLYILILFSIHRTILPHTTTWFHYLLTLYFLSFTNFLCVCMCSCTLILSGTVAVMTGKEEIM